MSTPFDGFARRMHSLAHAHRRALDAFVRCREKEEPDLDPARLRSAMDDYIHWAADLTGVVHASLARRGLIHLAGELATLAQSQLDLAKSKPTQGARGLPGVLRCAARLHCHVLLLNDNPSPAVSGDVQTPLQTAFVLLGEAELQAIYAESQAAMAASVVHALLDAAAADASTLSSPALPAPVFALRPLPGEGSPPAVQPPAPASSGRSLNAGERGLAGHWVYEEFYSGGHVELHMVLGTDGRCLRSSRSMASINFHDSMGQWAGHMGASAGLSAGERGQWTLVGDVLTLEMADDSIYEYRVVLSGASMVSVNTSDGARRLWTRQT